jgi:hypothetical protein
MQAEAMIKTEHAKRYLGQFCKHFAHKLSSAWSEDYTTGSVIFGTGLCKMTADDEKLHIEVSGDEVARLQDVVDRHLVRFGFREELVIAWNAVAEAR